DGTAAAPRGAPFVHACGHRPGGKGGYPGIILAGSWIGWIQVPPARGGRDGRSRPRSWTCQDAGRPARLRSAGWTSPMPNVFCLFLVLWLAGGVQGAEQAAVELGAPDEALCERFTPASAPPGTYQVFRSTETAEALAAR